MDIDVFDAFPERLTAYQFLSISRGGVYGNVITASYNAEGVFKLRNEQIMVNNQELKQSAATLHIRPSETFASNDMVGQGIRVEGQDYEIIGQTGGDNYAIGEREHYRLSLQNSDYSDFTESS
ncbi:hypothetical protein E6Q11_02220 [Candidatus Dojkabacteria bacterium]|jgi:hypothetical protein|uniref:Uncharacterized protein n=1 Tax=Candidatus Dojkabacteria bacterium TaxID=2099670 RepID=A0A5C7J9L4_9BACT|nr:MAG: hypothetical protein E6Q11_02220 [Candidatus Dojkabacteria bacterium]